MHWLHHRMTISTLPTPVQIHNAQANWTANFTFGMQLEEQCMQLRFSYFEFNSTNYMTKKLPKLKKKPFVSLNLTTCWSSVSHHNHYTKDQTEWKIQECFQCHSVMLHWFYFNSINSPNLLNLLQNIKNTKLPTAWMEVQLVSRTTRIPGVNRQQYRGPR